MHRSRKRPGLSRTVRGGCLAQSLLRIEFLEDRRLLAFTVNHTPYIQLGNAPLDGYNGGTDQAEILWQTTGTQDTDTFTARFRETGAGSWTSASLNAQIDTGVGGRIVHSTTFTGLNFDDDYDYEITHLRNGSPIATYSSTFHTRLNPSDGSDFTFVTYGDSASGDPPTNFIAVQTQINALDPAFSLLLGDNVYSSGTHAEYDLRLDPSKNVPLTTYNKNHIDYFGFGNHDVVYNSGQAARENYSMPIPVQGVTSPAGLVFDANVQEEENYSYDYGGVHFLTFDSNNWTNTSALDKQLDWAVADITAAQARATPPNWIIVFAHHPITSLAGHTEHTPDDYYYDQVLSRLGPSGLGVDLLLFGHAHNYQRSYPLTGHTGSTATYVLDTDNNYAKGAGLPLVIQGTGGVNLGYGAGDAAFSGSYVAKAMDSNTTVAAQYGYGKVDVTPTTLLYSYINTLGQVLDSFSIGPPPPDTTPPTAALSVPLDNGVADQNPAANQVTVSSAQADFQIQLTDSGDGVDDATVVSAAVSLTKDLLPLVAGVDYTFSYNSGTNVITLAPLPPVGANFGDGSYEISLSAAIEDLASNALVPMAIDVVVNSALPSVVAFQEGVDSYAGTLDTYVHEDEPTTNHGADAKVYQDGDDDQGTAETQAQEVQGLIRFNNLFSSGGGASRIGGPIPDGATILSATLAVRTGTASGDVSASLFNLHRMIVTWDESATWNNMTTSGVGIARDGIEASSTITASASGGNVNVAGGLVTFDVTDDVQLWSSNNALSLRGWLIHPDSVALGGNTVSGQTDGWWFDSSEATTVANRPILTVTYVVPPENVSAGGPYTISEGDSLALSGSATGTGSLTYSWDVNGDSVFGDAVGASPTLNWAQLVALGISAGYSTRNVVVRVSDGYGDVVSSAPTLLTINNAAPTADAGGPYTIAAGEDLLLDASASGDASPADVLAYTWDLNGDLVYGDAVGVGPTVSWAQLTALGITPGNSYDVRVRVSDEAATTTSAVTTLTVGAIDSPPRVTAVGVRAAGPLHTIYAVPSGSGAQLVTVPVGKVDQVSITFDEPVTVEEGDLTISGVNVASYPTSGFSYDGPSRTATWVLAALIDVDLVTLELNADGASPIVDAGGNRLDGEWENPTGAGDPSSSVFPSGNGSEGGNFEFQFTVLPGDASRDNLVDGGDYTLWADHYLSAGAWGDGDFSQDGTVDGADYTLWADNYLETLGAALALAVPAEGPLPEESALSPPDRQAHGEVFARLGHDRGDRDRTADWWRSEARHACALGASWDALAEQLGWGDELFELRKGRGRPDRRER